MSITYDKINKIFHLQANDTSYVIKIVKDKYIAHLYWGRKIRSSNLSYLLRRYKAYEKQDRCFGIQTDPSDPIFNLDTLPQEYPAYGTGDFRHPAYQIQIENGSTISSLEYHSHKILKGKPKLEGLPATYVEDENEAETLKLEMVDSLIGLKIILFYTTYEKFNVITRSVYFLNEGKNKIKLLRALSMSIDFNDADYDLMHLYGSWGNEMRIERRPLISGNQSIESRRGNSSPQHNPFLSLLKKGADEDNGDVYGFSLVYSGNFIAQAEVDQFKTTRVSLGINPFDFTWLLEEKETFQTPEAVLVYSSNGIGDMSRTYHKLYRTRLCRGKFRDKERPVFLDTWDAVQLNINTEKLLNLARISKELGIEVLVQDYGWTINCNTETIPIGDWVADREKFPKGLEVLGKEVKKMGIQFGLWIEPENVSKESNFYKNHPDWVLHVPKRNRSEGIGRLVLDLSRKEVCETVIKMISEILLSAPINFVRWDMNRHMTEIGSAALPTERQRETAHRYMLGLYRIMEEIKKAFPNVLFEGCSGGGGRFDPGILYYHPQILTSDNNDAVDQLKIKYGASIVYPLISIEYLVNPLPYSLTNRDTSLIWRGHVAMSGNYGLYLDVTKLTEIEREIVRKQIETYKEIRHIVQFGNLYRLLNPYEGNEAAWMFVSEDKTEAVVNYFRILNIVPEPLKRLRLKGLDLNKNYTLIDTKKTFGGDELMYAGLNIPKLNGDFKSFMWVLKANK